MKQYTLTQAAQLATHLWNKAEDLNYYIGLTGSTLYNNTSVNDIDIILYKIEGETEKKMSHPEILMALGFEEVQHVFDVNDDYEPMAESEIEEFGNFYAYYSFCGQRLKINIFFMEFSSRK